MAASLTSEQEMYAGVVNMLEKNYEGPKQISVKLTG